jgi:hypothetical protein
MFEDSTVLKLAGKGDIYSLTHTDGKGLLWELTQQVSEEEKWMNMKVNKCSYRFFPYRSYSLRSSL